MHNGQYFFIKFWFDKETYLASLSLAEMMILSYGCRQLQAPLLLNPFQFSFQRTSKILIWWWWDDAEIQTAALGMILMMKLFVKWLEKWLSPTDFNGSNSLDVLLQACLHFTLRLLAVGMRIDHLGDFGLKLAKGWDWCFWDRVINWLL